MQLEDIPNLDLGDLAGPQHRNDELHYERLGTLANLLGRSMSIHRHDRFFQVHYVKNGTVRLQMDERLYCLEGPMLFLTPPAYPHAFVTDDDADGHVLTTRQELIWPMLSKASELEHLETAAYMAPMCLALQALGDGHAGDLQRLNFLFDELRTEYASAQAGRTESLHLLTKLIFISLMRLSPKPLTQINSSPDDLQVFQRFNALVEQHFQAHWTIPHFARALGVTEQRLNEISRSVAGKSSKRLVYERLMQEARRLLVFTRKPVSEICYTLGFRDPAYFSRFFQRHAGQVPGRYRASMKKKGSASLNDD